MTGRERRSPEGDCGNWQRAAASRLIAFRLPVTACRHCVRRSTCSHLVPISSVKGWRDFICRQTPCSLLPRGWLPCGLRGLVHVRWSDHSSHYPPARVAHFQTCRTSCGVDDSVIAVGPRTEIARHPMPQPPAASLPAWRSPVLAATRALSPAEGAIAHASASHRSACTPFHHMAPDRSSE
jgi:hypothetical protein